VKPHASITSKTSGSSGNVAQRKRAQSSAANDATGELDPEI